MSIYMYDIIGYRYLEIQLRLCRYCKLLDELTRGGKSQVHRIQVNFRGELRRVYKRVRPYQINKFLRNLGRVKILILMRLCVWVCTYEKPTEPTNFCSRSNIFSDSAL